jgi:hypothetical protein
MAQHDFNIANQSFPSFRTDLNNALSAINTSQSGTSRPSGAVAGTIWLDTTSATTPTLKYYDGADDISLATLDHSANTVNWLDSTVSITGLSTTATGTVLTLTDTHLNSTVSIRLPTATGINDDSGNEYVKFTKTASAVNEFTVANSATGSAPEISTTGGDTDIDLKITPKGAGKIILDGLAFPNADGSASQVLQTNGSGVLSFSSVSAGFTLLGTLTTTSGATQTLGSLTLTDYKLLFITFNNVSSSSISHLKLNAVNVTASNANATDSFWGNVIIDLSTSSFTSVFAFDLNTTGLRENSGAVRAGNIGYNTSTTSIEFSLTAGNFDSGTIKIYGVK